MILAWACPFKCLWITKQRFFIVKAWKWEKYHFISILRETYLIRLDVATVTRLIAAYYKAGVLHGGIKWKWGLGAGPNYPSNSEDCLLLLIIFLRFFPRAYFSSLAFIVTKIHRNYDIIAIWVPMTFCDVAYDRIRVMSEKRDFTKKIKRHSSWPIQFTN